MELHENMWTVNHFLIHCCEAYLPYSDSSLVKQKNSRLFSVKSSVKSSLVSRSVSFADEEK